MNSARSFFAEGLCRGELIQVWKSPRVLGKAGLFDYFETFKEKHYRETVEESTLLELLLICCRVCVFVFENTVMTLKQ